MTDQERFEARWRSHTEMWGDDALAHCMKDDFEAFFLAALDIGRKERTVEIHKILKQEGYDYATRMIAGQYPECFGEGDE